MRAIMAVLKSTSRLKCDIWNKPKAETARPKITSQRASNRDSRNPTIGIRTMIANPPGESTRPLSSAV